MEAREQGISFRFFYEQVFASTVSNMLGIVIGHPLDTIKLMRLILIINKIDVLQKSVMKLLREMFAREGASGFFKGLMSPLAAATPFCALIFTINELSKRHLQRTNWFQNDSNTKYKFYAPNKAINVMSLVTGCFSGGVGVAVYTPIEVLKCRAQATKDHKPSYRQLIPEIIKTEGYRGLYRGFLIQTMRDVPGWGIYFCSYEVFKKAVYRVDKIFNRDSDFKIRQVGLDLVAGGFAGSFSWFVGYPIDIIKTQIQVSTSKVAPSIRQVLLTEYRIHGVSYFFRGLSPTLIRAFPVNAVTLASFDYLQRWIKHDNIHRDNVTEKPLL